MAPYPGVHVSALVQLWWQEARCLLVALDQGAVDDHSLTIGELRVTRGQGDQSLGVDRNHRRLDLWHRQHLCVIGRIGDLPPERLRVLTSLRGHASAMG